MDELEKQVKKFLTDRAWDQLRPGDLAKSVAIEAGELLELFQWDNPELEEVKNQPDKLVKIKKELADVLTYCLDIAVLLELDTQKIILEKLEYINKKYPPELMRKNAKKGAGSGNDSEYWRIKEEYRKNSR